MNISNESPPRGGYRPGAGRPKTDKVNITVRVPKARKQYYTQQINSFIKVLEAQDLQK